MKTLTLKGKVFSGKGEGKEFITLPWVRKQFAEKIGFIPYPGTLNIRLMNNRISPKELPKHVEAVEISPAKGFCRGKCIPAYFSGSLKCVIVIPEVENYPSDVVEIAAPVNLREIFKLKDGDVVEVKLFLESS
ncbi:MAG: DUF120 domain-containing protein [Candidatus Bathyarchaeia archaeon]